ncbi:phosphonate ABC transporter, permease protein PhnE [Halalkalibacillus sediminis]|uniref:Phosphonate ABC transporter, permease protein PhnE n=2 Tax=Halalkalibacillus sediminis TaxID=2018042 RepID=A0A2I0QYE2_9BACI|nr:phosphonate ABC transporter, permease protein PhnE [Halalkalibacillus sediminis]PKR79351.1 phosphonate ABC transporter, permease protein PhnE [Halalkalibacillus sediminis]
MVSPWRVKGRLFAIAIIIIALLFYSSIETEVSFGDLAEGFTNTFQVMGKFFPPETGILATTMDRLIETIHMAIISTTFATIFVIPLSLLAAQNITTNKWVYNGVRFFLNILRTVPDIVLAVIFVGIFGIGVFSGIIALFIFSMGILAKLISETIEAVDMEPIQAMRASGAGVIQSIYFGLVPQVLPQFTSFTLYVFEINIRASVVIGLVGAGGIGLLLNQQIQFYSYPSAMMIIIVIFLVVVVIEYISTKIREAIV